LDGDHQAIGFAPFVATITLPLQVSKVTFDVSSIPRLKDRNASWIVTTQIINFWYHMLDTGMAILILAARTIL
jgi:hypothetical protein